MINPDIKSSVLIESRASESDDQFKAGITQLLENIYGKIPEWLEFNVGRRISWRNSQFREFICVAGSVSSQLIFLASRPEGISRAIILYGSSRNGRLVSREIRNGVQTELDPEELQAA